MHSTSNNPVTFNQLYTHIEYSLAWSCMQMSSTEEGQHSLAGAEAKLRAKVQRRNIVLGTVLALCVGVVLVGSAAIIGVSQKDTETLSSHTDVNLDARVRHLVTDAMYNTVFCPTISFQDTDNAPISEFEAVSPAENADEEPEGESGGRRKRSMTIRNVCSLLNAILPCSP